MNTNERTQVGALARFINFGPHRDGKRFTRQLHWVLKNEPGTVLSPRQKYLLQSLCYRYRRQLAGRVHDSLIPTDPPQLDDYVKEPPQHQSDLGL